MPMHPMAVAALCALTLSTLQAAASDTKPVESLIESIQADLGKAPGQTASRLRLNLLWERANDLRRDCPTDAAGGPARKSADDCKAELASLQALQAALREWKDSPLDRGKVEQAAALAQARVDKLRLLGTNAFDRGDAATAAAVAMKDYEQLGSGSGRSEVQEKARQWVRDARSKPRELRRAIGAAQREADRLVEAALDLRDCQRDDPACVQPIVARGVVALAALNDRIDAGEKMDKALSESQLGLEILATRPDSGVSRLDADVAFRTLLGSNPDVQSFFGGDAVGFSAGADASTLSFRVISDFDGGLFVGRRNRLSLIFSAPLNKDGVTNFASTEDSLRNLTTVKIGWQLTNAPFKLPGPGTLNDFAVGLSAGQETRSYFRIGETTPTKPATVDKRVVVLNLGVRWAFLANPTKAYKTLMVFGHDTQRGFSKSDVETRCPVEPGATAPSLVGCSTGVWEEPKREFKRFASFELRQHLPALDIGLRIKQNLKTDKVDAEIPLYLIRTLPDQSKKTPFTAGISVARRSGEQGLKWGVFVSAPLSFGKPSTDGR